MKFKAYGTNILVRKLPLAEEEKKGMILTLNTDPKMERVEVLSVGEEVKGLKAGDIVHIKYGTTVVFDADKESHIAWANSIIAIEAQDG